MEDKSINKINCLEKVSQLVIPGCAARRRPGIHNPSPWLWIPGSRFARPGMTAAGAKMHHAAPTQLP